MLREAVKGLLPQGSLIWRKKSPYPKTWHPRYRSCVTKMMEEVIHDPYAPLFDIIKKERVMELLKRGTADPVVWTADDHTADNCLSGADELLAANV